MAFLVFERTKGTSGSDGSVALRPTGESFRLAGYNLIYRAWEKRGQPVDQGWHVSADELIRTYSRDQQTSDTRRLVIDFHPRSRWRIGLIELLDVYAYSWGNNSAKVAWTPLMLRLRDVFYEEFDDEITPHEKNELIKEIPETNPAPDFVEFLYLNGADKGWSWGMNGRTNAAFLRGDARAYFRQFF